MKTTFYVVRHAESNANIGKGKVLPTVQKKGGSRLSTLGIEQAHTVSTHLQDIAFDEIYSS